MKKRDEVKKQMREDKANYEYTEPEDINNTYNILSLADVYYGNRFMDFSLAAYAMEITGGVSLITKNRNSHYVKYNFPWIYTGTDRLS